MPSSAWKKDVCRSEEHTSELQSLTNLVCRLLLEKTDDQGRGHPMNIDDICRKMSVGCRVNVFSAMTSGAGTQPQRGAFGEDPILNQALSTLGAEWSEWSSGYEASFLDYQRQYGRSPGGAAPGGMTHQLKWLDTHPSPDPEYT